MKHIKKFESTENVLTFRDILKDTNIEWINADKEDYENYPKNKIDNIIIRGNKTDYRTWVSTKDGKIEILTDYVKGLNLVFKHDDLISVIGIYELHGVTIFKDNVIIYGHENIVIYDTSDFSHKLIYTR